ncbi:Protein artichoke, partial [Gryllus bimaculatus]
CAVGVGGEAEPRGWACCKALARWGRWRAPARAGAAGRSHNLVAALEGGALAGLRRLRELRLAHNHLTRLNSDVFQGGETLEHVDLAQNSLAEVPSVALRSLTGLRRLNLSANSIKTLEGSEFPTTLTQLDLSRNGLGMVPGGVFSGLRNLRLLDLGVNAIRTVLSLRDNNVLLVPAGALAPLPRLALLDLDFNRVSALSADILRALAPRAAALSLARNVNRLAALTGAPLQLAELRLLDLSRNQLGEVARAAFSQLPQLQHLNLSRNPLQLLPSTALHPLRQLVSLDLSRTGLKLLPPELLQHNQELQEVYLSHNVVQEIPEGAFGDLQNLTVIDLSHNHIANIRPGAFTGLASIRRVSLRGNRLSAFKGELFRAAPGGATSLEELDLSDNELSYLFPSSFRTHPQLRRLHVANNRFSFFPAELIVGLRALEELDLSGNALKSVEELDFARLPKLRVLRLARNSIEAVSESAFHNSSQLQVLDLSDNRLERVGERTFEGLVRLELLDLSANHLAELPDALFERSRLQMLENINLARNKFEVAPLKALQRQYFFLSSVDLSHNLLHEIPPEDSIMVNIKRLDLSFNPLSEAAIANVLGEPKTVRELNLAGTGIERRTTLLEELDVSYNRLGDVSGAGLAAAWPRLAHLQRLDLSGNPLGALAAGDLDGLGALRSLRLAHLPEVMRVEKNAFRPLAQLAELSAYDFPRLGYLDVPGILQSLPVLEVLDIELKDPAVSSEQLAPALHARLRELSVRGPRVRSISSGALAGLRAPSLCVALRNTSVSSLPAALFFPVPRSTEVRLDVTGSRLTTLAAPLLAALDERRGDLALVGLDSNPILCDCNARALRRWLPAAAAWRAGAAPRPAPRRPRAPSSPRRATRRTPAYTRAPPPHQGTPARHHVVRAALTTRDQAAASGRRRGGAAGKNGGPATGASGLNNDDTLIIGIVGGVVAFIAILIIVICIIRLRITNGPYRGPVAAPPSMIAASTASCTCVKPPGGPPLYMAPYAPGYAATLPPKFIKAYKILSNSSEYLSPTVSTPVLFLPILPESG